ncbi:speriolin-like protein [Eleginops maclovinus]|uniref:speriolin-like protein n=1 Tax=Eleginops maclovinus TaxID=56733 RepID=UPI003080BBB4
MDLEQTVAVLLSKNEQLGQENHLLKSVLGLLKENVDLTARMQSCNNDTLEELTVCSTSGRQPPSLCQHTFDERQFKKDIQQTRLKRTSSPVDFTTFIQSSVQTAISDRTEFQSSQAKTPFQVKGPDRLLGEVAYQLDRRILSHIFQGHRRLYGFTLLNIPGKIKEVSTHPLTGKVDEGYQLHLTQRHGDLMKKLNQLGYKTELHPAFTEFIVNNYGILKERPGESSDQATDYNNPNFLMKLIMTKAPTELKRDLLVLLTCLCSMADGDRKPLLLW